MVGSASEVQEKTPEEHLALRPREEAGGAREPHQGGSRGPRRSCPGTAGCRHTRCTRRCTPRSCTGTGICRTAGPLESGNGVNSNRTRRTRLKVQHCLHYTSSRIMRVKMFGHIVILSPFSGLVVYDFYQIKEIINSLFLHIYR